MYRPPDIDNFADFYNYYRNRWIGLPLTHFKALSPDSDLTGIPANASIPITLVETQGAENKLLFSAYLPVGGFVGTTHVVLPYKELLAKAQFGQPQIGMIEYGRSAAFYEKGSPRIAHRGLPTPRRHDFYVINGFAVRHETLVNGYLVWQCFNPTFLPFIDAVYEVQLRKREAAAIAPDWAVSSDGVETLLWFRTQPIAYVESGRVRMFPDMHGEADILEMEGILPATWTIRRK